MATTLTLLTIGPVWADTTSCQSNYSLQFASMVAAVGLHKWNTVGQQIKRENLLKWMTIQQSESKWIKGPALYIPKHFMFLSFPCCIFADEGPLWHTRRCFLLTWRWMKLSCDLILIRISLLPTIHLNSSCLFTVKQCSFGLYCLSCIDLSPCMFCASVLQHTKQAWDTAPHTHIRTHLLSKDHCRVCVGGFVNCVVILTTNFYATLCQRRHQLW